MLVFWKAHLVLLAVPKTGTSALEHALLPHADAAILNPPQKKHCTVRRYNRQLRDFFEKQPKRQLELAAVIREPVSWLDSLYRFRGRAALRGTNRYTGDMTFDTFVERWLADEKPVAEIGRQSRVVADGNGQIGVDHLFRYDRLDDLVRFLEKRIGTKIELERRNASPAGEMELSDTVAKRLPDEAPVEFELWERLCET